MRKSVFFLFILLFCVLVIHQPANAAWTTKRLTWNSGRSMRAEIALSPSGHIHVVWYDKTPGNDEIFHKKSTDGGSTWTSAKRLSWSSGRSYDPTVAVDSGNNIHVVWQDDTPGNFEIYYKKSTDGGGSWTVKRMTWNSGNSANPTAKADTSGNIHVFFDDSNPGNAEIFHKKSTDGGINWTTKRVTWNSENSMNADIFFDASGNIHLVWGDNTPGNVEIFYKKSTDGGATWVGTKRLCWNSEPSNDPKIALDGSGNIHVVWHDYTPGHFEIYYSKSSDGGSTWTTKRMTWSEVSMYPAISINSSGHIHVFWAGGFPYTELYFNTSTDGGSTWGGAKRLTWNSGSSSYPEIAIDSSENIHLVWHDSSPGNFEIYYKQKN